MKKKMISGKALTIGGLCLACIAILVGILVWKTSPASEFTPDADNTIPSSTTWVEPDGSSTGNTSKPSATPGQADNPDPNDHAQDNYKVASETEEEIVIDMTPPASQKTVTPPPAPKDQTAPENNAVPSAPAEGGECIPSTPEKKPEEKPGQVNDPVFGLSELPRASGSEADSNGDPNKMIGSMS